MSDQGRTHLNGDATRAEPERGLAEFQARSHSEKFDVMVARLEIEELRAPCAGVLARCDAWEIGRAAFVLGAGRLRAEEAVHPGVGVRVLRKVGDRVQRGEPLAVAPQQCQFLDSAADRQMLALDDARHLAGGIEGQVALDRFYDRWKDQPLVLDNVANQIAEGNRSIVGVMLESNLESGNQAIPADLALLRYGVSVTDGCLDWEGTADALRAMRKKLRQVLPARLDPA